MKRVVAGVSTALLVAVALLVGTISSASAECGESIDLGNAAAICHFTGDEVKEMFHSGDTHVYRLELQCRADGTANECFNPRVCGGPPPTGFTFSVYIDGVLSGDVCLSTQEAATLGAITPAMVLREMQRLDWPRSELVVQPPDGQTLVNLETNFYTTNTAPTVQTVTLLGQQVAIEATPTSYRWHSDVGGADEVTETTSPGAAYPALEVTHTYAQVGVVQPAVDTVYTGRFRVNGGPWQAIPETVTLPGAGVPLLVREAGGVLVGYR